MSTVTVPTEVAKALDHYKESWSQFSEDERAYLFMGLGSQKASNHEAEILKTFAQERPTIYMQAFMNGYKPEPSLTMEIVEILGRWIDEPWLEDRDVEFENISKRIIRLVQQKS